MPSRSQLVLLISAALALGSCANDAYLLTEFPNYDHLIGKRFSEVISLVGQRGFRRIGETNEYEDLEERRPDGCATVFGIRKKDGVIAYWR